MNELNKKTKEMQQPVNINKNMEELRQVNLFNFFNQIEFL